MQSRKKFHVVAAVLAAVLFAAVSCDDQFSFASGSPNDTSARAALRAVPIPASDDYTKPWVIGSYSEGASNFYLIDVGTIRNMYLSTLGQAHYNGMTPVSITRSTVNSSALTKSLTNTVSSSVTIADTKGFKTSVEASWKNSFLFVSEWSVKANYEYNGSTTNTRSSNMSKSDTLTTAQTVSDTLTYQFTIGGHGEPAGYYRYAMYSVCDVYFLIETSLDNQTLKRWETYVCAREIDTIPHMDYSANGRFDNSPIGDITFSEDFYKNLPPVGTTFIPVLPPFEGGWVVIRGSEKTIDNYGRLYQWHDQIRFDKRAHDNLETWLINLDEMRLEGYRTVDIYIRLDVVYVRAGIPWLFLYSSAFPSQSYELAGLSFRHGNKNKANTRYSFHYEDELKFENIPIDKFMNNEFILRYGATDDAGGNNVNVWKNKNLQVKVCVRK